MASDRSQSQGSFSRDDSLGANGARREVNGGSHMESEASERDVNGDVASDDGDGDLFGDEGDEEPYIKPYALRLLLRR